MIPWSDVVFKGLLLWKAEIAIIKCSLQLFLEAIHPHMKRSGHIYETLVFINALLYTVHCLMETIVTLVRYRRIPEECDQYTLYWSTFIGFIFSNGYRLHLFSSTLCFQASTLRLTAMFSVRIAYHINNLLTSTSVHFTPCCPQIFFVHRRINSFLVIDKFPSFLGKRFPAIF